MTAPNGDIFIADGHVNNRVVKFSKDGTFIKAWGKKGSGPGEFNVPHTIAMDSRGRLFVGDRNNSRIQLFDQDGKVFGGVEAVQPVPPGSTSPPTTVFWLPIPTPTRKPTRAGCAASGSVRRRPA